MQTTTLVRTCLGLLAALAQPPCACALRGAGAGAGTPAIDDRPGGDMTFFWYYSGPARNDWALQNLKASKFGAAGAAGAGNPRRPSVSFSSTSWGYVVNYLAESDDDLVVVAPPPAWAHGNVTTWGQQMDALRPFGPILPILNVMGIVTTKPSNTPLGWSCTAGAAFLANATRRAVAVSKLVEVTKQQRFAGWNIDQVRGVARRGVPRCCGVPAPVPCRGGWLCASPPRG